MSPSNCCENGQALRVGSVISKGQCCLQVWERDLGRDRAAFLHMQAQRLPLVLRKLQAGDRLAAGDKLESSNGLSTAILQHDGNFVVRPLPLLDAACTMERVNLHISVSQHQLLHSSSQGTPSLKLVAVSP